MKCTYCGGRGTWRGHPCPECHGTGEATPMFAASDQSNLALAGLCVALFVVVLVALAGSLP